jgi:hypothetical protein
VLRKQYPAPKFSFRCRSKTISTRPQGAGGHNFRVQIGQE